MLPSYKASTDSFAFKSAVGSVGAVPSIGSLVDDHASSTFELSHSSKQRVSVLGNVAKGTIVIPMLIRRGKDA
jgi:hypothetical protein